MTRLHTARRWSTGARILLAGAVFVLIAGLTTAGVAATVIYRSGTIGVEVDSRDTDLSVVVPAGLAHVAIALVPSHLLADVTRELQPWVPMVEDGYRELLAAPDFTMVEVRDGDDHIVIRKKGRSIDVLVEGVDERIEVSVPLRTIGYVLDKLS